MSCGTSRCAFDSTTLRLTHGQNESLNSLTSLICCLSLRRVSLSLSSDVRQLTPQLADLTPFVSPGKHSIELRGGGPVHASAYVNASYYLPWTDLAVSGPSVPNGDAESLRYSVKFDRTTASTSDVIRCTVHAERVGFRGYGMMLAEVGLPPGADVDCASSKLCFTGENCLAVTWLAPPELWSGMLGASCRR
jgi:hypothetical protein